MAGPKPIPQPGDVVAGKYLLESMLGQGGMGAVFRARHTLTDRKCALKWMLPDADAGDAAVQRFLREARAMGRIDHPSVVGVLDVGVEGDAAYLVMELLRGSSLRDRIEAKGKLGASEAVSLLLPAMEGVAAAHLAGVVHRDLKPDNLFCVEGGAERGTTKVLDFGVSKLQGDRFAGPGSAGSSAITHTGAMVGTPAYMAPEQVRGERDLDARTDVWALGAILYEALAGRTPFEHETLGQTIVAIATAAPPRLESVVEVPTGLADVVHRALEKDPAVRWQTVEAFASALVPYGSGVNFNAPHPSSQRPPALASGETSLETGELAIPKAPRTPTGVSTMPRGSDPSPDIHVSVAIDPASKTPPSSKTSTSAATPYVSSTSNPSVTLPTSGPPWAWIGGTAVVVALGIGAFALLGGSGGAGTPVSAPPSSAPPPSAPPTHLALAARPADAGTDAAVALAPPPSSSTTDVGATTAPEPPSTTHGHGHGTRVGRTTTTPPSSTTGASAPPPTTGAATAPGRTGRLSRDDF